MCLLFGCRKENGQEDIEVCALDFSFNFCVWLADWLAA